VAAVLIFSGVYVVTRQKRGAILSEEMPEGK
jgi:hypothetical protein